MNIIKKVFGTVFVIILILSVSINAFAAAGEEALMPDYTPMPFGADQTSGCRKRIPGTD